MYLVYSALFNSRTFSSIERIPMPISRLPHPILPQCLTPRIYVPPLGIDPPQVREPWGQRAGGGKGWGRPGQPSSLPQPERVLLALRRYLRAERKEQRHTLRHYQHVAAVDPEKAQQTRLQVLRFFQLPNAQLALRPRPLGPHPSSSSLAPHTLFPSLGPPSYPWNLPLLCLGPTPVPQILTS